MLLHGRAGFLLQLSPFAIRSAAATIEMAFGRHSGGQSSFRAFLCRSLRDESSTKALDDVFIVEPGADSTLFRIRNYSLPLDGRGHYFQARAGAYCGDGSGGGGVLCAGGIERRNFSHEFR